MPVFHVVPEQFNGYDCAVLCCMFLHALLRGGVPSDVSSSNMDTKYYRLRNAADL